MEDEAEDETAIVLDSVLEADNNKTSNLVTRPALFLWTVEMIIINVTNIQTNLMFGENAFFIQQRKLEIDVKCTKHKLNDNLMEVEDADKDADHKDKVEETTVNKMLSLNPISLKHQKTLK
jgi:hypothetical protein